MSATCLSGSLFILSAPITCITISLSLSRYMQRVLSSVCSVCIIYGIFIMFSGCLTYNVRCVIWFVVPVAAGGFGSFLHR